MYIGKTEASILIAILPSVYELYMIAVVVVPVVVLMLMSALVLALTLMFMCVWYCTRIRHSILFVYV